MELLSGFYENEGGNMVRKQQEQCLNLAQMQIIINSRVYWRERAVWLRAMMGSNYLNTGSAEHVFAYIINITQRLTEILIPFFGREISEQYSQLLTQSNIMIRELIEAQLSNDLERINQLVNSLYQNNQERAALLSSINPFWNEVQLKYLMDTYLLLTIEQANALASGNYNNSVFLFDQLMAQADLMGDYFAYGIYSYLTLLPRYPIPSPGVSRVIPADLCVTYAMMNFIFNIRMFWFNKAIWTRIYSVARTFSPEYAESVYAKLRQLPIQYGALLKTVFDNELVDELLVLVYEQIDLITSLISAQLDGNIEEVNRIVQRLYQNADERAALVVRMNPFVNQNRWRNVLYGYLQSTIEGITTYLAGDNDRSLTIYQRLLEESEHINNEFTESLLTYLVNQRANLSFSTPYPLYSDSFMKSTS